MVSYMVIIFISIVFQQSASYEATSKYRLLEKKKPLVYLIHIAIYLGSLVSSDVRSKKMKSVFVSR